MSCCILHHQKLDNDSGEFEFKTSTAEKENRCDADGKPFGRQKQLRQLVHRGTRSSHGSGNGDPRLTIVTSGRKCETLTGNKFSLGTFVDTPGLVDGDMKYPFDVNEAITWIGGMADLVFVFFDPIGQALCKRTLNLVEKLNEKNGDRIRFFLSKADEAGHESERQRVMMQIVQELCKRPGLNK